jgi:predicted dithiol-disulfide oxidoreductase (DUF899 family)
MKSFGLPHSSPDSPLPTYNFLHVTMKNSPVTNPIIVSPKQWLEARREFLAEEKEFSKMRDSVAAHRRNLPWVKVDKPYVFDTPGGRVSLADMFEGRSQLIVYHFMLAPGWDEGCRGCSYVSDHFDGAIPHLNACDVSFTAVSCATLGEIERFKTRMGWKFDWASSFGTSFNRDFGVSFTEEEVEKEEGDYNFGRRSIGGSEMPGLTVFARGPDGAVYRTYSTYSRGLDLLIGAYNLLDLVPKGRDEDPEAPMKWVNLRDRYEQAAVAS